MVVSLLSLLAVCEQERVRTLPNKLNKKYIHEKIGKHNPGIRPGRPQGSPWGVVANLWYNTAKMSELWAMLHDKQAPETTEHGRSLRPRRRSEQIIVSELRGWLLHDYVAAYCRSLAETRIFRRSFLIDALGIDPKAAALAPLEANEEETPPARKKRTQHVPAHPVLQDVLALSHELAARDRPITLHSLVLTAGSSKRARYNNRRASDEQRKKPYTLPKESGLITASWLEAAQDVLDYVEQSPAIFLLNPLGATTFHYDDLAPLYRRTVPTELCLLLSHKQIVPLLQAARTSGEHATHLTALLRSDRWKTLPAEEEQSSQAVAGWIALFTASMQHHFLLPVQRIPLIAQVGPAIVDPVPYTLIFATRRQDSLVSMNDAVCAYTRRVTEASWQGVLGEEWFANQHQTRQQEALQRLEQQIVQQGRQQRIRRWSDLRQQLMLTFFGQFMRQDYDASIQKLLLQREVRCEWRQRKAALNGNGEQQPIPGNDDILIWR
jgi:hypothetical protein